LTRADGDDQTSAAAVNRPAEISPAPNAHRTGDEEEAEHVPGQEAGRELGTSAVAAAGAHAPGARERAAALLEATHQFPGEYFLTVIALHDAAITARLVEAVKRIDQAAEGPYLSQPSSGGKYVSHRFSVRVAGAADVLELYALVRTVEGVVTVM